MTVTPGDRIDFIQRRIINPRTKQPIELEPFQTTFIENLYAEGVQEGGFSLPRKNGKTGLLGALALSELALNDDADVVLGATKVKQANRPSGVFGVMKAYMRLNQGFFGDWRISRNNNEPIIVNTDTGCQAEIVSMSDVDAAQGLNPSLAIMDEYGTSFWTPERWGAVAMSMGGRGPDARVVGISTPASQLSAMYEMRTKVLNGTASKALYWQEHSAPLDWPIYDLATWERANPALYRFLSLESLDKDRSLPEHLFRLFRLGQWIDTSANDGWLGVEGAGHWDATAREVELDPLEDTWIGVDKSAYDDMSAVVAVQRYGDGWISKAWIFEPAPTIDHAAVRERILQLHRDLHVVAVGYDNRYFVEGAQMLSDAGVPMIDIPQAPARLVPVYGLLHKAIVERRFWHDDDARYRSHVLSAVPVIQPTGGFTLSKNRSRAKIDAAVATGIAFAAQMSHTPRRTTFADGSLFK
ncbi:MAG: hypothetical protein KDB40_11035 [Acidimicrobiales bacterium]|nr:hypothetical protein [Acidimicrobiales bacterium]MCB9393813.1 hypothetical protein [Acidimicrobiaceae bacterium]